MIIYIVQQNMPGAQASVKVWMSRFYATVQRRILGKLFMCNGAWCSVLVKALHYQSHGLGIDSRWCRWGFFFRGSDRTMCPGVDSASENKYQGFLLVKRRPVPMADDLPPSQCRTSRKSGALTYPEPLGPVQACCGMTLYLCAVTTCLILPVTCIPVFYLPFSFDVFNF